MKRSVKVTILGQQYSLRSDAEPEDVQRVAEFVNQKLSDVAADRVADTLDTAILALMNVAGTYLDLLEQRQQEHNAETRLRNVLGSLERVCPDKVDN